MSQDLEYKVAEVSRDAHPNGQHPLTNIVNFLSDFGAGSMGDFLIENILPNFPHFILLLLLDVLGEVLPVKLEIFAAQVLFHQGVPERCLVYCLQICFHLPVE